MNKTATRRAFLLGASGFCLGTAGVIQLRRYLQSRRPAPLSYERFPIDARKVKSDLSADQIDEAFKVLFSERDMWLRFRGLSADVQLQTEIANPGKKVQVLDGQGAVALSLKELPPSLRGLLSYESQLEYSDRKSGASWKYVTDRVAKREFTGDKIPGVDHTLLLALLYINMQVFSDMPDTMLEGAVAIWRPTLNYQAKNAPRSYRFKETGHEGKMMELAFENGHVSEYRAKEAADAPDALVLMRHPMLSSGIWYPTEFDAHLRRAQKQMKCTLRLNNLNIIAAT